MPEERVTIEMEGRDEEAGELRLSDFISELEAFRLSLHRTEREITTDREAVAYRVAEISHNSPYKVTVAIIPRHPAHTETPRRISKRFTASLRTVRRNHRYARQIDPDYLDGMKGLTAPINKTLKAVRIYRDAEPEKSVPIDGQFSRNLAVLTATHEKEVDEIVGWLEQANIHNQNQFHIYPKIGPTRVLCKASVRYRDKIIASVGKRVTVEGIAHYRKDAPFPHQIDVLDIVPFPPDSELPRMSDLHGIAPGATGSESPEDFVRGLRDAHW
jgi:hypothetical protein